MKLLERDPCFEDKGNEIMNSTPKDSWKHLAFHETNKTKNIWKWIVSLFHVPLYIGIFSTYFYENKSQNQMDIRYLNITISKPFCQAYNHIKTKPNKASISAIRFPPSFFFPESRYTF